jgi:hypothetical protein
MMTCSTLTHPEDLKILTREGIAKLCPPSIVAREYEALQFIMSSRELGTQGHYLLVGLLSSSSAHLRLRDVLLHQPNAPQESMQMILPWYAPPYLTLTSSDVIDTPRYQHTPEEIATYLKRRFLPQNLSGKRHPEIRWVTTCLTSEPTEMSAPRYADWEASSFLHVTIGILTHGDGIRHSGFEGQTLETSKGLLVLVACAL